MKEIRITKNNNVLAVINLSSAPCVAINNKDMCIFLDYGACRLVVKVLEANDWTKILKLTTQQEYGHINAKAETTVATWIPPEVQQQARIVQPK